MRKNTNCLTKSKHPQCKAMPRSLGKERKESGPKGPSLNFEMSQISFLKKMRATPNNHKAKGHDNTGRKPVITEMLGNCLKLKYGNRKMKRQICDPGRRLLEAIGHKSLNKRITVVNKYRVLPASHQKRNRNSYAGKE